MKVSAAIVLATVGVVSAAAVDIRSEPFTSAGDALDSYLENTIPAHHDATLNAREDLTTAELTARAAIDSLVESVALEQRSPEVYITTLGDARHKREAEPWCNRNKGMGCWKVKREADPWCDRNKGMGCWKIKREAEPWCNRNKGMGCWKAKRDAAPGPWCNRNKGMGCWKNKRDAEAEASPEPWCNRNKGMGCWKRDAEAGPEAEPWCNRNKGMGCWKYKREELDSASALLEQRECLGEGGLCQHARRAAEAVLGELNTVEDRESDLAIAARNILDSLQVNY